MSDVGNVTNSCGPTIDIKLGKDKKLEKNGKLEQSMEKNGKLEQSYHVEYKFLPKVVKDRIKALKKLQLKLIEDDCKFYKEIFELEIQHDEYRREIFAKRRDILNGDYEPTEEECDQPSSEEDSDLEESETNGKCAINTSFEGKNKLKINEKLLPTYPTCDESAKGIPEFWLTVFRNSLLCEEMQKHDEPILKHLTDITLQLHKDTYAFTLSFHFSENEYFTNKVLTKFYQMKCGPSDVDPFTFEGPEIINCKGCTIDWKKNMNVTLETADKITNTKSRDTSKSAKTTRDENSFFSFFNPLKVPERLEFMDSFTKQLIDHDFELGHYMKDRLIPKATLFYTGHAYDEDEENDENDDEGEDYEDVGEEENEEKLGNE